MTAVLAFTHEPVDLFVVGAVLVTMVWLVWRDAHR